MMCDFVEYIAEGQQDAQVVKFPCHGVISAHLGILD